MNVSGMVNIVHDSVLTAYQNVNHTHGLHLAFPLALSSVVMRMEEKALIVDITCEECSHQLPT